MKSLTVLLFIGAITVEDVVSRHHHHHSEYAQLQNLIAQHHEFGTKAKEAPIKISNKEHNEFQEYFENHPQSVADKKVSWNEGMLHHVSDDYINETPAGYTFAQAQTQDDPCVGLGCERENMPKRRNKGFPMNYPVPNFGQDQDIATSMNSLEIAQNVTGHNLVMGTEESKAKWHVIAKDPQASYNLNPTLDGDVQESLKSTAQSEDLLGHQLSNSNLQISSSSDPICSSSGCGQYAHPEPPKGHPMDYPVPNFGKDPDMVSTMNSVDIAEKQVNHKLVMGTPESKAKWHNVAKDTPYDFHPSLDKDVIHTNKHITDAEDTLGQRMIQIESDPICSSAGCGQYAHPEPPKGPPMDYPVPSFGKDPDMTGTMNSLEISEKMNNHKLIMGTPESKAKWHIVAKDTLYDYHPALDKDVITTNKNIDAAEDLLGQRMIQLESDPICSSAGCGQYAHPEPPKGPPMDYPVPSFGKDPDMTGTMNSLEISEKMNNHKLIMGTPESKAKWHIVAKDTLYDYHPALDKDVITTNRNIDAAEDLLGQRM